MADERNTFSCACVCVCLHLRMIRKSYELNVARCKNIETNYVQLRPMENTCVLENNSCHIELPRIYDNILD